MRTVFPTAQERHMHGVMVQLPLDSKHRINTTTILDRVHPAKDVDAIGTTNLGRD